MCNYLLTWIPEPKTAAIRTLQSQEFDDEDSVETRAQELLSEGATEIRRWAYDGTLVVKTETYWRA